MFLDSTKTNIEVSQVLSDLFLEEAVKYATRVVYLNLNSAAQERITAFLAQLENEFRVLCSIRKFTILNTNVVRENQNRILENDTLRSFYFEMFKSVTYRLDLDYSIEDRNRIFTALCETAKEIPCSDKFTARPLNQLIRSDQDFKNLCGSVYVDTAVIEEFLGLNPWYLMMIIANICAPALVENVKAFSTVK